MNPRQKQKMIAALSAHLPEIRSMAMMPDDPRWREEWHRPWCCEFHYVLSGTLAVDFRNGQRITANTSELLLIPAGIWHRDVYDPAESPRVFMLFFSWRLERVFWRLLPRPDRQTLRLTANGEISAMFKRIQTTLKSGTPLDELVTRVYVQAILLLALRLRQVEAPTGTAGALAAAAAHRRAMLISKAKHYVEQNYREYISLDGIAESLGVSPYHLSHVFSRESGSSLFEYLAELRMRQARLLLQSGKLSVKEVAMCVGHVNLQYFSRAFHRHYGTPPRAFLGAPFAGKSPKTHRRKYA